MRIFLMAATAALLLLWGDARGQTTFRTAGVQGDSCYCSTCVYDCNCAGKHPVFNIPTNETPHIVPRLGSNPQFGTLRNYTTTEQVFRHLKRAYAQNHNGNAAELDRLWKAMGYSGFSDSRFTVDRVAMVYYEGGITGMLGAGGHKYLYATIAPGSPVPLKAYRIQAEGNNCDISIMETCGNAFFSGCGVSCTTKACALNLPAGALKGAGTLRYGMVRNDSCFVSICEQTDLKKNHPVYNIPTNEMPRIIPELGTNPQFGTLRHYTTTQQVYDHLKRTYAQNKNGNAAELDRLWRAMGYSGFSDPSFTVEDVTAIAYEGGITGMLGAGGHHYVYATVSPGKKEGLRAYRINAPSNCDISIMETCGNAFFSGCPVKNCQTYPCGCQK